MDELKERYLNEFGTHGIPDHQMWLVCATASDVQLTAELTFFSTACGHLATQLNSCTVSVFVLFIS